MTTQTRTRVQYRCVVSADNQPDWSAPFQQGVRKAERAWAANELLAGAAPHYRHVTVTLERSDDGGQTWTTELALKNDKADDRWCDQCGEYLATSTQANGRWLCIACKRDEETDD